MIPAFTLAWAAARGWTTAALGLWRALPGPVQAGILIAAAGLAGVMWGEHVGARRCAARIDASIAAAREADARIGGEARARAERETVEARAREGAVREEVKGYADELAKRTAEACRAGADADRYNDGLGVHDDPVQRPGEKPAAGRGRGPVAVPLPPRKGL